MELDSGVSGGGGSGGGSHGGRSMEPVSGGGGSGRGENEDPARRCASSSLLLSSLKLSDAQSP